MPSPFVYGSLQSMSGYSIGTLLHVNSLFSLPVSYILWLVSIFCPFSASFVSQNCVCYQSLTTGVNNLALCSH